MNTSQTTSPSVPVRPLSRRSALRALAVTAALAAGSVALPPAPATADATETYALTIRHLDRAGAATAAYTTHVTGVSGPGAEVQEQPHDPSGTVTLRLPKGRYLLDSAVTGDGEGAGTDWIVQPRLDLAADTTVTVDARTTAPVDVRPPETTARPLHALAYVEVSHEGARRSANLMTSATGLRVGHLGPAAEPGSVRGWIDAYWSGARADYGLGHRFTSDRALTGLVRRPAAGDLATLTLRAADREGAGGTGFAALQPSEGPTAGLTTPLDRPGTATFLVTPGRGRWDLAYSAPAGPRTPPHRYEENGIPVRAGGSSTHTFDNAVLGPALVPAAARPAGTRDGDTLALDVPLLADGEGHAPSDPVVRTATTTLHRDGVLVGTRHGTPGRGEFTTTPGRAAYRLTATATHGTGARPGRTTAAWTFVSERTARPTELPLSAVRFTPSLALDGTAPADTGLRVPVAVQGAATGDRLRSLTVSVSTDGGTTWTRVPVTDGAVVLRTPAAGRTVSLRAEVTDTAGNTLTQTQTGAFRTR